MRARSVTVRLSLDRRLSDKDRAEASCELSAEIADGEQAEEVLHLLEEAARQSIRRLLTTRSDTRQAAERPTPPRQPAASSPRAGRRSSTPSSGFRPTAPAPGPRSPAAVGGFVDGEPFTGTKTKLDQLGRTAAVFAAETQLQPGETMRQMIQRTRKLSDVEYESMYGQA
jgi:hypothetical protein